MNIAQIPALIAGIHLLFDVGKTLIPEILKRRGLDNHETPTHLQDGLPEIESSQRIIASAEEATTMTIERVIWEQKQSKINHLVELLETYHRNYNLASKKRAQWGDTLVPPIVMNELQDAETNLIATAQKFKTEVESTIGVEIYINEFLDVDLINKMAST